MTMVEMLYLLPPSLAEEVRRSVGMAAGWAAMMLTAWPCIRSSLREPVRNYGFTWYADLIVVLGCAVYGIAMLAA